ncbi:MAG: helix-turn-helix domain-containing protein [Oscillospiraceae bacterium]|nr:helix-turn-helix domain-containing protein [Oscillospiraceae bacterium]
MKSSEYYTPAEAAEYLKICKATIYKMIKTGTLPAVRAGRQIRIAKSNIDRIFMSDIPKETI